MKIKKITALLLCIALLFSLCGCDLGGAKSYGGNMEIPEDGIIKASVLSQIKNDHAVVTFSGESTGIRYEWTVFGDDIEEVKELNLGLVFNTESEEKVSFSFLSSEAFGFAPVLSIYLNTLWDTQNATVYDKNGTAVCGASVTGKGNSILNFAAAQTVGTFFITPDRNDTNEEPLETENGNTDTSSGVNAETDPYLFQSEQSDNRVISDGKDTEKDKYLTDPVPAGKPKPVEPENQEVNKQKTYTCTFSIECSTILNNIGDLDPDKMDAVPSDGIILSKRTATFYEGESVYDVLQRLCRENGIQMEASWTPIYNSAYVEGIHNLYEFDCGSGSGWMYRVNGWYPNYGCSRYQLADGEVVEWRYTCDLGNDVGGGYAIGG